MKRQLVSVVIVFVLVSLLLWMPGGSNTTATAFSYTRLTQLQKRLLSGFAELELNPDSALNAVPSAQSLAQAPSGPSAPASLSSSSSPTSYSPGRDGCSQTLGGNIKVNQNCSNVSDPDLQGRAQAQNETSIAADPNNPNHLVAASNDYRRGDGTCGVYYSLNGGLTWEDATTPNGFTRGTAFGGVAREYWQAGGDPAVAWDTKGNAYLQCQVFLRGVAGSLTNNPDASSAVYIFRSTQNNGASWNFTGRPVVEDKDFTGDTLEDKPLMTVDNHSVSPYQDRVYVTWTEFAADGTGYIWESYSNDYGEHFSPRVLVSANSPFCTQTFGLPTPQGNCNENQFSQPFTGPDGALYVTYANFNNTVTGSDNRNQMLLAKSTDGGASFSAPVKVGDYYDLPDCATYQAGQDAFRACVPEKGPTANSIFRATNYPSGAVNPKHPNQVVVSFGSYINMDSKEPNCVPAGFSSTTGLNLFTGVKTTPGCKNAILLSVSNDGGATFTGGTTDPSSLKDITRQGKQKSTDQFWQWLAFTPSGKLAVSYYDRQYGDDETTGYSDFSVSASDDFDFIALRATSASNPPPTQFGGVFMGDYTGLEAVDKGPFSIAYPFWADTRNAELFLCSGTGVPGAPPQVCTAPAANASVANEQEVFTALVPLFGKGH